MTNPGGCTYGPDSNGMYGDRTLEIYDGRSNAGMFNLIESNRLVSGAPPETDGGDALTLVSPKNIVRYNEILNGQNNGVFMKTMPGAHADNNRIYNNTIVWNGRFHNTGPQWQGYGFRYTNWATPIPAGNVVKNNILYGNGRGDFLNTGNSATINSHTNNWLNANGDPVFVDGTHSDLTSTTAPNLSLQGTSGAINGGTYLTQTSGSGSNSATLIVGDALYFQDGTWGSSLTHGVTLFPDWIAVGNVSNVVQISSINYDTKTIILATPISWNKNDPVWLYKNSSGNRVLYGTAPALGAHAYAF
jgi:hypothetical protein